MAPVADSPKAASTTRDRPAAARGRFLEAAIELFSEQGYDSVSLGDVATAAGLKKSLLLYHFQSKDELWKAAVNALFADVDAFFADELPQPLDPSRETIRKLLTAFLRACLVFPGYVRIPFLEGTRTTWRSEWLARQHMRRHVRTFEAFARTCGEAGLLPKSNPVFIQNLLAGGGQVMLGLGPLWRAVTPDAAIGEDEIPAYVDTVMALLD